MLRATGALYGVVTALLLAGCADPGVSVGLPDRPSQVLGGQCESILTADDTRALLGDSGIAEEIEGFEHPIAEVEQLGGVYCLWTGHGVIWSVVVPAELAPSAGEPVVECADEAAEEGTIIRCIADAQFGDLRVSADVVTAIASEEDPGQPQFTSEETAQWLLSRFSHLAAGQGSVAAASVEEGTWPVRQVCPNDLVEIPGLPLLADLGLGSCNFYTGYLHVVGGGAWMLGELRAEPNAREEQFDVGDAVLTMPGPNDLEERTYIFDGINRLDLSHAPGELPPAEDLIALLGELNSRVGANE